MMNPLSHIRRFFAGFGPVERAQTVASTAVVVTMVTILSAMGVTGQSPRFMDFISILAVGVIGFTSVYFLVLNARQLDDQRRQLLALNAIAEAVNRVVVLDAVLNAALQKVTELLGTPYGWIYLLEDRNLVLRCARGTTVNLLSLPELHGLPPGMWLKQPRVEHEPLRSAPRRIPASLKALEVEFWISVPLRTKDAVSGVLVIAGKGPGVFNTQQAELLEAFGNQITVALSNAALFEALRESQLEYADLFENSPDLYLSVDRRHLIDDANKHGTDLLGFSKAEIVGRPFESLFVGERQDAMQARVERMFTGGEGLRDIEEQMVTAQGKVFFVLLNSTLVVDAGGAAVHARIVARDISERKRMEAAILHAQKIDSIGNLAGGIAHDFNNILAAILGSASIMRRHISERARLAKYVDIIESAARRGSSLTRQLLTFARKSQTETVPVDVNALILETLEMFQRSVSKEIVVETALAEDHLTVNGDDGQIQQALLNLFLNARDAMPDGGRLTVATAATVADGRTPGQFLSVRPGPFVEIRVSDSGPGIPREIQNRIFEPFFTTKDQGTGLGLSVVYGVIQNHGGFINLESSPGHGTTFAVFLPRSVAELPSSARKRRPRIPHGTEHILVIEDEESVSEIARDMLSGLGYTVYVAHDGREGVELYRTRQASIDLVLLDINMPVMSGQEAFEALRRIQPQLRIIIVTGYGKGVIDTPRFSSDVNGFVQKPFQLETLAFKVRKALDEPLYQTEGTM
jgi:PAS domain S-box-containing protein